MMRFAAVCFFALAASAAAALDIARVELATGPGSAQPAIVADGDRGFIVTWQQREGARTALHFVELDADGAAGRRGLAGSDSDGSRWFVNWADFPALAVLDNGDWIAYWLQKREGAPYAYDIHLVRSTDRGARWSESMLPHRDGTASEHGFVSLLPAGGDRVLAMWLDGRNTGAGHAHGEGRGATTLRSAIIDRDGGLHEESEIDARVCDCCSTDAAMLGDRALLLFRDRSADDVRDIGLARREADGRWSEAVTVHADGWKISGCPVNGPALAVNGDGVLAVWTTMRGEHLSVRAAHGDAQGFGRMRELDAGDAVLGRVDAAAWRRNGFLATWVARAKAAGATDASSAPMQLRIAALDRRGRVRARDVVATLPAGANPGVPRIASNGRSAMAVWTETRDGQTTIAAARIRD